MILQDICQNKIASYDIRLIDEPLIQAAINLGTWLAEQQETTDEQKAAILQLQTFFRNLPQQPLLPLNVDFGFQIYADTDEQHDDHLSSWWASVGRRCIEIGSSWTNPEPEHESFACEIPFSWILCPSEINRNLNYNLSKWIAEVSNPQALVLPNQHIVIDAWSW